MSNLFKTELVQQYAYYPSSRGHGELVKQGGYWAMDIEPATFYNSSLTPKAAPILQNEFAPNTQYLFDMWIDGDLTVSQDINRPAGLTIIYTDDTGYNLVVTGNKTNPLGYQHLVFVTPSNKSVKCISSYYYSSYPTYYRIDSLITPISNPDISKQSIISSNQFTETLSGVNKKPGIQHGNIFAEQFYEI